MENQSNMLPIKINKVEEYEITLQEHQLIQQLLQQAFHQYPLNKSYFNQLPSFRLLAWHKDQLIGHMGVTHRLISLNQQPLKIFGIIDLCVAQAFQSQKIASTLLTQLENMARTAQIDFLMLIAHEHQLYLENGFQLVENIGKWLLIQNQQTLGVAHRRLDNCLMVKSILGKKWENGSVDFLGGVF